VFAQGVMNAELVASRSFKSGPAISDSHQINEQAIVASRPSFY